MRRGLPEKRPIKDVKKVIAVSSAKGGVGKSTIAGISTAGIMVAEFGSLMRHSQPRSLFRAERSPEWYTGYRYFRSLGTDIVKFGGQ